ncbi:MAG: threonine synthase [Tabrizicola sp.]|jgi:threonine synthase|nr:threonine synthase [Tabrizicola sp.]
MDYISTRGAALPATFPQVILDGLAPDGGLYVPRVLPRLELATLNRLRGADFVETALAVLTPFAAGTIAADRLRAILRGAYAWFSHPAVAPLVEVAPRRWVLELFHGPTLAFKDHAMQILGPLMGHFLAETDRRAFVLCATSGDTGGAALAGLEGLDRVRALVLYPQGGVSAFQEAQMHALAGPTRHVVAVEGSFDDCQRLVKQALGDASLRERYGLAAVNSVNWGRIAAQAVYYAHASLRLSRAGEPVDFAVPTGNFGNAYSGLIARRMGFPVGRVLVATNDNDALVRVAEEGVLSPGGVLRTNTPAMDIQLASNFERMLFDLGANHDGAAPVAGLLGGAPLPEKMRRGLRDSLSFARVSQPATLARMKTLFDQTGYIADPHTALALEAAAGIDAGKRHLVTLATAHPAKFAVTVKLNIGLSPHLTGDRWPAPATHTASIAATSAAVLAKIGAISDT